MSSKRKGRGEGIGVFNVHGCSTNEVKKDEIGKMVFRRSAPSETKLKKKGKVMFAEVVGRVSGVEGGRTREGVALLLIGWLLS